MSITLLVVDDHEVVRAGLVRLFHDTEIKVVAAAANGPQAAKLVAGHKPDVVLLDVQIPEMGGFNTLDKIQAKTLDCRVVMLSGHDNPTYIARAIALGATDLILKEASRQNLITTIKAAAEGKCQHHESAFHKIADIMRKTQAISENGIQLTTRESQVLRHVALGLSNKEIGRSLTISDETAKGFVTKLLRKLSLTDRAQVAVWAVRKGLV